MPDLIHDDGFFPDKKAESIIAGAKSIETGQVAGECFGAAHGRPFLQPLQQPKNPIPNGLGSRSNCSAASEINLTVAMRQDY